MPSLVHYNPVSQTKFRTAHTKQKATTSNIATVLFCVCPPLKSSNFFRSIKYCYSLQFNKTIYMVYNVLYHVECHIFVCLCCVYIAKIQNGHL